MDSGMTSPLAQRIAERIADQGPIAVSEFVSAALYDPDGGFYMNGGRAGRSGDFLTAPEVGPLFGAVLARALDSWWVGLGRPSPFTVLDWGAGPGTLARSVLASAPECLESGALRWVAVEVSAEQRSHHIEHVAVVSVGGIGEALDEPVVGVVLANELLDNLAFDIVERLGPTSGGCGHAWQELRVGVGPAGFELVAADAPSFLADGLIDGLPDLSVGARVPVQRAARAWLNQALGVLSAGRVVVLDYGGSTAELAGRAEPADLGWLRVHRHHDDSGDWLVNPGSCDVTVDVAFDQLQLDQPATSATTQAEFLRRHGIDELVEEGRRHWAERAAIGDLEAMKARSRVREAEALLDPAGMGAFCVLEWLVTP